MSGPGSALVAGGTLSDGRPFALAVDGSGPFEVAAIKIGDESNLILAHRGPWSAESAAVVARVCRAVEDARKDAEG